MTGVELTDGERRVRATYFEPPERAPEAPLLVCIHGGGTNGGYFDLKGNSTLAAAHARGLPVLLPNRPGHGGSAPPRTDRVIAEAADAISALIAEAGPRIGGDGIVVIGHSIGGAVALNLVGGCPELPFRGVAVSGIGDHPSEAAECWLEGVLAGSAPEPPASFFFGPEGTYSWRGPAALRRAAESWRRDEVIEVMTAWPERFEAVAAAIRVPVQFRLAEHEQIWLTGTTSLTRIAAALCRAAEIDVALLPEGGHLYEAHKRGPELVADQLSFLTAAAAGARRSAFRAGERREVR